ncbi:hypothetical protein [Tessaracoccus sp. Z1128]
MSDLGFILRSGLIDLGENPTAQDQQMEQALMAAYGVFLNGALEVVERWGLKVLNRTMAVVSGTDLLVPVEVGARRAVKSASDEGLGDAYLCGRCRVPHVTHAVGTFVIDATVRVPIFMGLCKHCYRLMFRRMA